MGSIFNVVAVQKKAYETPEQNIAALRQMLDTYDGNLCTSPQIDFLVLPEIFTCPYDNKCFYEFAESDGGIAYRFLSELARDRRMYVVGGSVPELDDGKLYNTSYVFDRSGALIGKHRKVHLFDIDVPGGQRAARKLQCGGRVLKAERPGARRLQGQAVEADRNARSRNVHRHASLRVSA